MSASVELVSAPLSHLEAMRLADLHISCIDRGFISSFEPTVIAKLYQAFATHPASDLYVARDAARQIVGLAAVSSNVASLYRHFVLCAGPVVLWLVARRLMSLQTIGAVIETLSYPLRGRRIAASMVNGRELLNLCVAPSARGSGLGRAMVCAAVARLAADGGGLLKIVTGGHQEAAHRLYESLGARRIGTVEVHRGIASHVYELHVPCAEVANFQ